MFERVEFLGEAANKSAGEPSLAVPIHPILPGQVLIVRTVGDTPGPAIVEDSSGNFYDKVMESIAGGSGDGEGVVVSTYLCNVTNQIGVGDLDPEAFVRLTCPESVAAKGIALETFSVASGMKAVLAGSSHAEGDSDEFSVSLSGLPEAERLWFLHLGSEQPVNKGGILTLDPAWPAVVVDRTGTVGGSPKSNVCSAWYWKIASDVGASYSGAMIGSAEWSAQLLAFDEVPA